MQKLFLGIGVFSGILLYLIRVPILSFYELSPETMEMANNFLLILSVVVVGMSYQMPTNGGIIRGGGDTAFVVKMDLISIWGIVIPLSLIKMCIRDRGRPARKYRQYGSIGSGLLKDLVKPKQREKGRGGQGVASLGLPRWNRNEPNKRGGKGHEDHHLERKLAGSVPGRRQGGLSLSLIHI